MSTTVWNACDTFSPIVSSCLGAGGVITGIGLGAAFAATGFFAAAFLATVFLAVFFAAGFRFAFDLDFAATRLFAVLRALERFTFLCLLRRLLA